MDIEAISGPKVTGTLQPTTGSVGPVEETAQLVLFSQDIRDKVSISPEARRRYEARHKNKKARKED